jgi:nucleotidyltransferase substrate binding protein (TIGR01987 family)
MALVTVSLHRALDALERAVAVTAGNPAFEAYDDGTRDTLRAGTIQAFEVAYEQCWKMLRRWIDANVGARAADGVARRELFRLGAEQHLIGDVDEWMVYHESRNLTSHTYDAARADEAFAVAVRFLPAARAFAAALEARNA